MTDKTRQPTFPVLDAGAPVDPEQAEECEAAFVTGLADWAAEYVDETAVPVMARAHELFGVAAVRILVAGWERCNASYREWRRRDLERVAAGVEMPCTSIYDEERRAYRNALYALIVR